VILIVAPSALTYKSGDLAVRVVHYQHGDLLTGGTSIEGQFENIIDMHEREVVCVTVAGRAIRHQPGILAQLSTALADAEINVETVSSGMDSISFYVDKKHSTEAETLLHDEVVEDEVLSSVTVEEGIGIIRVTGGDLQDQGDAVKQVLDPLAEEHIYLHDVITSATSLAILVPWDDREDALACIQDVF